MMPPTDPSHTGRATTGPAISDPANTDPANTDPANTDPANTDPAISGGVSFRCPHCAGALVPEQTGAVCFRGHRFDRSVDGYLNLLPAGRTRGRAAGDSAEMIRARRALFDLGHYAPIMSAVAALCAGRERVLDAGCGEGSYIGAVDAPERYGIDVSKPGIRLAARRFRRVEFAVASSYRLPFDDSTFDAVISVFAPLAYPEFARVLRGGGIVVAASPGPDHLAGLRRHLYQDARPHDPTPAVDPGAGVVIDHRRVQYELSLDGDDARLLLQMTPYWWSATPEQQRSVGELTTAVDVIVEARRSRPE